MKLRHLTRSKLGEAARIERAFENAVLCFLEGEEGGAANHGEFGAAAFMQTAAPGPFSWLPRERTADSSACSAA